MTASERIRKTRRDREFWLIVLTSFSLFEVDDLSARWPS
jgi:hypothetical protein